MCDIHHKPLYAFREAIIERIVADAKLINIAADRAKENGYWTGLVRGGEPVVGIPPLDKNIPETYAIARREVDKLNLTGTLAV
jgi:hypothetical protein